MTKLRLKELFSAVSVAVLLVCAFVPVKTSSTVQNSADLDIPAHTTAAVAEHDAAGELSITSSAEPVAVTVSVSAAEPVEKTEVEPVDLAALEARFISMLDLNHGFNSVLDREESVAKCAAVSLSDYACDITGYGLCVSAYLVQSFAESFYGIDLDVEALDDPDAPSGYISLPGMGMDTCVHTLVSITETDKGFEVITCMKSYEGGEDYDTCLVRSVFIKNSGSEFGFNLISCETL